MEIKVSRHAFVRLFERSKAFNISTQQLAMAAYNKGLLPEDCPTNLSNYLRQQKKGHDKKGNQSYKVYAGHIFVFGNQTLITVLNIPVYLRDEYHTHIKKLGIQTKYKRKPHN